MYFVLFVPVSLVTSVDFNTKCELKEQIYLLPIIPLLSRAAGEEEMNKPGNSKRQPKKIHVYIYMFLNLKLIIAKLWL